MWFYLCSRFLLKLLKVGKLFSPHFHIHNQIRGSFQCCFNLLHLDLKTIKISTSKAYWTKGFFDVLQSFLEISHDGNLLREDGLHDLKLVDDVLCLHQNRPLEANVQRFPDHFLHRLQRVRIDGVDITSESFVGRILLLGLKTSEIYLN